jgi:anti-sigma-K factor RskA
MSNDLDDELRAALRPVDPGERFTRSVLARVAEASTRSSQVPRLPATTWRWASAALAISLVMGVLVAHQWQVRRTQRGLEARRELIQALRLTGEKLDLAYRAVNEDQQPERAEEPGA